ARAAIGLGIDPHAAKLQDRELAAARSYPRLAIKDRSRILQLDQACGRGEQRQGEDQQTRADQELGCRSCTACRAAAVHAISTIPPFNLRSPLWSHLCRPPPAVRAARVEIPFRLPACNLPLRPAFGKHVKLGQSERRSHGRNVVITAAQCRSARTLL